MNNNRSDEQQQNGGGLSLSLFFFLSIGFIRKSGNKMTFCWVEKAKRMFGLKNAKRKRSSKWRINEALKE